MRRFLSPRWLAGHALMVVLVAAFLGLGWWQWQRAGEGNARSFAYALEWPLFALFVIFMWVKEVRDALRRPDGGGDSRAGPSPRGKVERAHPFVGVASPSWAERIRADEEEDEELAAYNRYLARLNAQAERQRR